MTLTQSKIPFKKGDKVTIVVKRTEEDHTSYVDTLIGHDETSCMDSEGYTYDRFTGSQTNKDPQSKEYRAIHTFGYATDEGCKI